MKSTPLLLSIIATALVFAFGLAEAEDTIRLRKEVYVKGPRVLLGDVAEVTGENAEFLSVIEVSPAALPGGTKRLNAALLYSRLRQAGVDIETIDIQGNTRVNATTLSLEITSGMLAQDLERFIAVDMPWDPAQTTVHVVPPARGYVVSDGDLELRWTPNPQYRYLGNGTFKGEILIDGNVERTVYAKARIESYGDVVVASKDISRMEATTTRNLRLEKRSLSTLERGVFFSLQDLKGYVARSTIFAGQVLTSRKVIIPKLVKRNQIITVKTTLGALTVSTQARAMSDAAAGDTLICRGIASDEKFVGVLREDGIVIVE